jgi:hypothetical protein
VIETRADAPGCVRATFRLQYGIAVHEIYVVGEFNDWSRTANRMEYDGRGYAADIVMSTGRAYRFRYLIDGHRWQNDWAADSYAPNEFGGDDSVLDLTESSSRVRRLAWSAPQPNRVT